MCIKSVCFATRVVFWLSSVDKGMADIPLRGSMGEVVAEVKEHANPATEIKVVGQVITFILKASQ